MLAHTDSGGFPLTAALPGDTVSLTEVRAGSRVRQRLSDLGLNVGMQARVMQRDIHGPLILAVANDTRLAIGRGMAQKIIVKHSSGEK